MTSVARWWSAQGSAARLDLYIRWPLYSISAAEPLAVLLIAGAQTQVRAPVLIVFALVSMAHAGVCVALLRAGLARPLGGWRPAPRLVVAAAALTVAALAAGAGSFPAFDEPPVQGSFPTALAVVLLTCGALTAALAPLLPSPKLLVVLVVSAAAAAALQASTGASDEQSLWAAGTYALMVGSLMLTYRTSAWMLGVVREIDRSRAVHARLAVAEERLRFARDLHDVLGRNLSLVAVQSELAAKLAHKDQEGAAEQMMQVRRVAQDSLREMREVVGGYRTASLDSELAGARSVLRSAGVSARVIGDGSDLPRMVQAALGWVVREATTNVIRHSDATTCTIVLDVMNGPSHGHPEGRTAVLRMENDGAQAPGALPRTVGTGLVGLSERLAGLGGSITSQEQPGGRFILEARLPASGDAPASGGVPALAALPTGAERAQ